MKVLVTGAAGYIGSAVAYALADAGHDPVGVDVAWPVVEPPWPLLTCNVADGQMMRRILAMYRIEAVVHCAARVSVEVSMKDPLWHWRDNVAATVSLVDALVEADCRRVVFSSTAAVYGPADGTVDETCPMAPRSPYASSKAAAETALAEMGAAGQVDAVALRYFNVIGADGDRAGPKPGRPSLLARLWRATAESPLVVTGTDWPTRDGTGIRDYVHLVDVARAHVAALDANLTGFTAVNIGTGTGTTVRELVAAFADVNGPVITTDGPRRPGDVAGAVAAVDRAGQLLGWKAELTVRDAIRDELEWRHARGET